MNRLKKALSIMLSLLMIMTFADIPLGITASAAGGTGTISNPYLIATADDLVAFRTKVNDGETTACAKLTADIDFANEYWNEIAPSSEYTGTFDGGCHTIKNFKGSSLFRVIGSYGKVSNLILDCNFSSSICYKNYGRIENCVNNSASVGKGICDTNYGTVQNCVNYAVFASAGICTSNYGTVSGCANFANVPNSNRAGICFYNNTADSLISKCYNEGNLGHSEGDNTGGICTSNEGTVEYCYNTGNITGTAALGGIATANLGTIKSCYNAGSITGTSNYVGGIAGELKGGTIGGCYNYGAVTGDCGSICGECTLGDSAAQTDDNFFLVGTAALGVHLNEKGKLKTVSKTEDEFKALASALNLANGKTYNYRVRYTVNGKTVPVRYSADVSAKVYYKPAVTAKSSFNGVTLRWKAVPDAQKYAVYKYENGRSKKITETDKTGVRFAKLDSGKEYSYIVRAYVYGKWTDVKKSDIVTVKAN